MTIERSSELRLASQDDVVLVRQAVRSAAVEVGLNLIDQTKFVTAASEIARNAVVHGGGGMAVVSVVRDGTRRGVHLVCQDKGRGIADIELAMKDGYTSGGGLGLGLGGAKRLSGEFHLESRPGEGTRVSIARWKG